ncbi:MAG TPA: DoxX family protein [Ktedonobacteraceae bacterium]|nr:DoxX family protein [Ktedonobacteraceae bacterium]
MISRIHASPIKRMACPPLMVGLTLAGHGVQKLFGWFAGPGLNRLKQGFRPAWLWVILAIVGEVEGIGKVFW